MKDFKSKYGPWALVAGASEGLGEAFAREIASRGINVYLVARREEKLQELTLTIQRDFGIRVKYMKVDLSKTDEIKLFFSQLNVDTGLVVYNAAYAPVGWFTELSAEYPEKIVAVNVRGPVLELTLPRQ
jgi:short-subunit dehydrogenase